METINDAFASNLKRIREQRRLSLDALARLTGVSKSMLAQIERGEANPTISTVWKIANGLKLSFTALVSRPEGDYETVALAELPVLSEDEGRYRNYPVFPYEDTRRFEFYAIELDPGAFLQADAHADGAQEFIIVFSGEVRVTVGGAALCANPGKAIHFKADQPHSYQNTGSELCRLSMVISYGDN